MDIDVTMKPLLFKVVDQAVKLAIIDCCGFVPTDDGWRRSTQEEREEWLADIYKVPAEAWNAIDPGALMQNISCRLFGKGGWAVGDIYSGNAPAADVFLATFPQQDTSPTADIVATLRGNGLDARPIG